MFLSEALYSGPSPEPRAACCMRRSLGFGHIGPACVTHTHCVSYVLLRVAGCGPRVARGVCGRAGVGAGGPTEDASRPLSQPHAHTRAAVRAQGDA
eukprot:scaffold2706_cov109-Isochrysis_galbana.AAC.10